MVMESVQEKRRSCVYTQCDINEVQRTREARKEKVLHRLNERHRERRELKDKDKEETNYVVQFNTYFKESMLALESCLKKIRLDASSKDVENSHITDSLDKVKFDAKKLQESLAQAAIVLPSYELQVHSRAISKVEEEVEELRKTAAPRKKFAFSRRIAFPCQESKLHKEEESTQASESACKTKIVSSNELVVEGKIGETIKIENLPGSQDLRLCQLKNCVVWVLDTASALRCIDLIACKVYAGPVNGSCFVQNAHQTTIYVAAKQVRIHCSRNCEFYLHVPSNPIIEDCHGLRFAKYKLNIQGLNDLLDRSGLANRKNMWDQVDDFRWLRQQHSPNWELIDEEEQETVTHDSSLT